MNTSHVLPSNMCCNRSAGNNRNYVCLSSVLFEFLAGLMVEAIVLAQCPWQLMKLEHVLRSNHGTKTNRNRNMPGFFAPNSPPRCSSPSPPRVCGAATCASVAGGLQRPAGAVTTVTAMTGWVPSSNHCWFMTPSKYHTVYDICTH